MGDSRVKEIFRAYDIRGKVPEVLNKKVMKEIGKAQGSVLLENELLDKEKEVVVGRDVRNSSPDLEKALIEGLREEGINVLDLGEVPFGLVLFKSWREGKEAAYITASHLPKNWNGVKFYHSNGIGWSEEENYKVRDSFLKKDFVDSSSEGSLSKKDVKEEYIKFLLDKIDIEGNSKVLLDCGNGTSGLVAPELFERAGFEVETLFESPNGNFPNRDPGVKEDNFSKLKKKVEGFDFGIAYDGDSDRMVLVDEEGRVLNAGETSYVLLKQILENEKGPVVANVEVSRLIDDIAEEFDREVKRIRVGHTYLFKETLEKKGCFGAESSGHYCIPGFVPTDDGIATSLFAARVLSKSDKSLKELVDRMPDYYNGRKAFECADSKKFEVVDRLKAKFEKEYEEVNTLDGVRIDFDQSWVLIRASNTSPKIRITVEADSEGEFERLMERFSREVGKEIKRS